MTDTIDLLDAIGRDASLRHAPADELARALQRAHASEALTCAAASGDSARLTAEFGQKSNQAPQVIQTPGFEEDEENGEEAPLVPPPAEQSKPLPLN